MQFRSFKLINASEIEAVTTRLDAAWRDWCVRWWPEVSPEPVVCERADAIASAMDRISAQWRRFVCAPALELHIAMDPTLPTRLASLAFSGCVPQFGASEIEPSRLLDGLMNTMLRDLAVRVFEAAASGEGLTSDESSPQPHAWARGSGSLSVRFAAGGKSLDMLLSEALLRALTRDLRPLVRLPEPINPRRTCLNDERVRVELWAGETEIELGVLQGLCLGDVILLDVPINEPLQVAVEGRPTGRYACLGRQGSRRAMQLMPADRARTQNQVNKES
jgi:hypothetical protein